ncbi:RHS repeat-associated core domain-containing protein [Photorhabdus sp. CRCIA-P01]|uniref:RHS repeat-associated core domain-containing protein n=1 Tax=Photorhabdus sp. CRCIA-P01 TaxID=2019570 RepID=UPI000E59D8A5|nr:RHS repeat-associated core domain-containing protein [Photorhabdus sp. CRCIA-P01]
MSLTLIGTDLMDSVLLSLNCENSQIQQTGYSPWGGIPAVMIPAGGVPGFNGERIDPVSGTSHLGNGYRAYNPTLMRFSNTDSWSPFGAGGINSYSYCLGDPINRVDPSGHMSATGIFSIVFGVIGIALAVVTGGLSLAVTETADAAIEGIDIVAGGEMAASAGSEVAGSSELSVDTFSSVVKKGGKLAKKLAPNIMDVISSSTSIASAAEESEGNDHVAKILGITSLVFFGIGIGINTPRIYHELDELSHKGTHISWRESLTLVEAGDILAEVGLQAGELASRREESQDDDDTADTSNNVQNDQQYTHSWKPSENQHHQKKLIRSFLPPLLPAIFQKERSYDNRVIALSSLWSTSLITTEKAMIQHTWITANQRRTVVKW